MDQDLFFRIVVSANDKVKVTMKYGDFYGAMAHVKCTNNVGGFNKGSLVVPFDGITTVLKIFILSKLFNMWMYHMKGVRVTDKECLLSCISCTTFSLNPSIPETIDLFNYHFYNLLNLRMILKKKEEISFEMKLSEILVKILAKYSEMDCWVKMEKDGSLLRLNNSIVETSRIVVTLLKTFQNGDVPQLLGALPVVRMHHAKDINPSMKVLISAIRTFVDSNVVVRDVVEIYEKTMLLCVNKLDVLKEAITLVITYNMRSKSRNRFDVVETIIGRLLSMGEGFMHDLITFTILTYADVEQMRSIRGSGFDKREMSKIVKFVGSLLIKVNTKSSEFVYILSTMFCVFGWDATVVILYPVFKSTDNLFKHWLSTPVADSRFKNIYKRDVYMAATGLILKNCGNYKKPMYGLLMKHSKFGFGKESSCFGLDVMYRELFKIIGSSFKYVI